MKVCVIGLGEIGGKVLREVSSKFDTTGVDIDIEKVAKLKELGYNTIQKLSGKYEVYIICVYTNQQVLDVIENIDYSNNPLVCIESTITPKSIDKIKSIIINNGSNLVVCPHRYFAGDNNHGIFNQKRVIAGATDDCLKKGFDFYQNFMNNDDLITTDLKHAVFSKLVENSYRFVEIAIAEELKLYCDRENMNFNELQKCTNSKWNIDIKEARKGIGGKCLPKDIKSLCSIFKNNLFFNTAIKVDEKYKNEE